NITTDGKGEAQWNLKVGDWGRYLVRVCDTESGHCAGDYFYAGYPWYDEDGQNREAAAMLAFSTDKDKYQVGETVQLSVPASANGYAFVSVEDGTKVLNSFWKNTKAGDNIIEIKTTPDMAPNVYAHISLMQPHAQQNNDLPIRMYGIASIMVENPKTILQPQIAMPNELQPEQTFTVEVSETNNQPMAYTIAVVDDGLLDLTNFKTPNPHAAFYAKEALGVQTWDVYDQVIGGYGGELERILSIGGDGEVEVNAEKDQANRFQPVVMHLGPFYLRKGKAKHEIKMPNYIGSVRTMVVAANPKGAYGNVEKTTAVKSPLMVLATLPRVLGTQERLQLPVTVFAGEQKVKNVEVSIRESSGLVKIENGTSKRVRFAQPGEETIYFDLQIPEVVGVAKFTISAKGNGESASQEIEIEVRNPNPYATDVQAVVLNPNENHMFNFEAVGIAGTNTGTLEVSNIPPIDLGRRLRYLLRYPHGCIEQTTSAVFPQLYVKNLLKLKDEQAEKIPTNIEAGINRLKQFQTMEGGFAYWPGQEDASAWGSNYGGHFLLEAKAKGYQVSSTMLNRWTTFQQNRARNWRQNSNDSYYYSYDDLTQAYRLYTLALAGAPELAAMNRMREMENLSIQAKWRLAAAYALTGKKEVAKTLVDNTTTDISNYQSLGYTYGSDLRDRAMIVETLVALGDKKQAASIVQDISKQMSQDRWYNTQTTAYCLLAVSKFVGESGTSKKFQFTYQAGSKIINAGSDYPLVQVDVPVDGSNNRTVRVENKHNNILYARLILSGQPAVGQESAMASNLEMEVRYTNLEGDAIDPSRLTQGTDFIALVDVRNPGTKGIDYDEMALTQIFPSGWEIINTRMDDLAAINASTPEYQDIRDDRVYTYFDIRKNNIHSYRIRLNAAYQGRYYLSGASCAAMYDDDIQARKMGQWVEVVGVGEI
ncbi:MAG: alpha-2-macroglobulin family protein, partial [Bacteroidota bacterium]